uniref:Uncharacterized protein n=1 Tax=Kalanchoe fedtschenkoi TaxID=63787 RepID=A0A7N1A6L1_KALFE
MGSESDDRRSQTALRCANAAHLLYSLKTSMRCSGSAEEHEAFELEDVVMRLRVDLVRERVRMRRVKLCGVVEMLLQVMLLISVWSFILILAFN